MMDMADGMKGKMNVEVILELGHKAWKNIKPTIDGYTHDWTVFVQGVNGNDIKHIVEKVIFHLPDSYPDSKQIKEKPPFVLSESTSQSFSMQIEIFFCAESKLDKVTYLYDLSINDEVVNGSWTRILTFPNPSKNFMEKLLLAGGKMVDPQKTCNTIGALVECKVEPNEETEDADKVEALNSPASKIDDLHELLKENEALKSDNAEVEGKIINQKKFLYLCDENLFKCEACFLSASKSIDQLKKRIETDENEISTLKLQVQMLQNELLQMKNLPKKNAEEKKKGRKRKRKNKEHLNISDPVEQKREEVTHPAKVTSSSPRDDSCALQNSSSLKNISVSTRNVNICKDVTANCTLVVQNSSLSKADNALMDSNNLISEGPCHSRSKNEIPPLNDNSTLQQKCGQWKLENSYCHRNASSEKSEKTCNDKKFVSQSSVETNSDINKSEIKNSNVEKYTQGSLMEGKLYTSEINDAKKPAKINSITVNASLDEPKIRSCDIEEPVTIRERNKCMQNSSPIETNASLNIPETKKIDDEKCIDRISAEISSSLSIPEIANCDIEEPVKGCSIITNTPLNISNLKNYNFEKSAGKISIDVDSSLSTSEIRNNGAKKLLGKSSIEVDVSLPVNEIVNDVEKLVEANPAKTNADLNISAIKNTDVEKSAYQSTMKVEKSEEKNSVTIKDSLNKSEIRKNSTAKFNTEKFLEKGSVEANVVINKCGTRNKSDEKILLGISQTMPLIKSELIDSVEKSAEENSNKAKLGTESCKKKLIEKSPDDSVKEQHVSSIQRTGIKSFNSNCIENCKKRCNCGDFKFSSSTKKQQSCTALKKEQNKKFKKDCSQELRNVKKENSNINTIFIEDTVDPNFMQFIPNYHQKLRSELDRIKNSKCSKFQHKTNPLYYKLGNVNSNITDKYFMRYIRSLTDFFTNPKAFFDGAAIIYFIVHYLCKSRINPESLHTYVHNQDVYVFLPRSESCIMAVLYEIEKKSLSWSRGLIKNILNIIHRVIVSKKQMNVKGLASLCRFFMSFCKNANDRWKPLFLCCELLRLKHPLAPYLINLLSAVWREPFYLYNDFSVEEEMLLGSIVSGMKEKPLLMSRDLWRQTCVLSSVYFPHPIQVDCDYAIQFLTGKIVSRCDEGSFEDLWMLTSPLIIFVSNKTWDLKIHFRNEYILPNLLHFSRCLNEHAFYLFCNLYVDIFSFCHESPFEELMKYFTNTELYEGITSMQDCAAVALLKYIGITNRPIPTSLRKWFLINKKSPKLAVVVDIYCKNVMESQDRYLLWDDIIIL